MNEELKKLYESLVNRGAYSKTFEEFTAQYEAPEYRGRIFEYAKGNERLRNELGLTAESSLQDFEGLYAPVVKKKEEAVASTSRPQRSATVLDRDTSAISDPRAYIEDASLVWRGDTTPFVDLGPAERQSKRQYIQWVVNIADDNQLTNNERQIKSTYKSLQNQFNTESVGPLVPTERSSVYDSTIPFTFEFRDVKGSSYSGPDPRIQFLRSQGVPLPLKRDLTQDNISSLNYDNYKERLVPNHLLGIYGQFPDFGLEQNELLAAYTGDPDLVKIGDYIRSKGEKSFESFNLQPEQLKNLQKLLDDSYWAPIAARTTQERQSYGYQRDRAQAIRNTPGLTDEDRQLLMSSLDPSGRISLGFNFSPVSKSFLGDIPTITKYGPLGEAMVGNVPYSDMISSASFGQPLPPFLGALKASSSEESLKSWYDENRELLSVAQKVDDYQAAVREYKENRLYYDQQAGRLSDWQKEQIANGNLIVTKPASVRIKEIQDEKDRAKKELYSVPIVGDVFAGLSVLGGSIIEPLMPTGFPGQESISEAHAQNKRLILEEWGVPVEDQQKGFSEQDSWQKGAAVFAVNLIEASGPTLLAAATMNPEFLAAEGSAFIAAEYAPTITGVVTNMARTGATTIARNPVSFGLMGMSGANSAYREVMDNPNMSELEKQTYAFGMGMANMITESGAIGDLKAWNAVSSPAQREAANSTFKNVAKNYLTNVVESGGGEMGEEAVMWTYESLYKLATGQDDLPTITNLYESLIIAGVAPSIPITKNYAGTLLDHAGGTVLPYSLPKSENLSKLSELKSQISNVEADMQAEGISEFEKNELQTEKNKLNQQIYDLRRESIDARQSMSKEDQVDLFMIDARIEGLYDEFSKANTLTRKKSIKKEVASLLDSKRKIEQKAEIDTKIEELRDELSETKTSGRKVSIKNEIEILSDSKEEIENAVQEQATSEVLFQPEAAVSEEMEEGAPQAEPEVTAEARVEEEIDPDLKNIDEDIVAARSGDVEAQQKFSEYGIDWQPTTTYRFVGKSETDALLSGEKIESKRGGRERPIDVTTSSEVTTATDAGYRVTFKESFDVNNGLGKVVPKSKETGDHFLKPGRGYSLEDVKTVESIDENGNVKEVLYDATATQKTKAQEATTEQVSVEEVDATQLTTEEQQQLARLREEARATTEQVAVEEFDATQLTTEEQQQLARLREEAGVTTPVMQAERVAERPVTMAEVNAAFDGGRKISNNLSVNETNAKPLDKKETDRRNRIEKIATKGAKSVEKILPDTKVMLHSTEEEFSKYTGSPKTDEGAYDYNTNTIHINMATADASAVGHEIFHALFLNEVKTNDKARAVAQKLIEGVRNELPEGSELAAEIDAFAESYEENFQNEERLAQLMGAMSREYTKADQTVKGRIKRFIADLAKFFGIDLPSNFGKTDASVMAMLDTISRKVSRGETIQKEDVTAIKKAKRAAGKRAASKKASTRKKPTRKEQKPDAEDIAGDNALRRKKGLITITQMEASKYEKMGITDQYRQQILKDLSISTGKENMLINAISDGKIAEAIASSNKLIAGEFPGALTDANAIQKKLNSINVKDSNSVLKTMEELMPDGTALDNLDFVMSQVAINISKELKSGSYLGQPVVIETDSEAITKAMLFEAQEAYDMGLSRSRVARLREGVNDPDTRAAFMEKYRETQQESLNKWADALANAADGNNLYFNLLMADAIATNNYDASEQRYFKRSPKTIRNFTPFDAGTLQRVELETNVEGAALLKTYIEIQKENIPNIVKSFEYSKDADGTWLMFPGGSDVDAANLSENSNALMQLVQETVWCTKTDGYSQLSGGNFYVYVTKEKGEFKPRIAVRTEDNGQTIREVRGIAPGQQMEPKMNPKAVTFLTETLPISGGKKWVEGNEFNKSVQEYTADIKSREVTLDDFKRVAEIEERSARFSDLQYGENGFVETLREELDFAVSNNRLEPRLKGNVTDDSRKIRPNTVMFLGDLNVSDVVETGIIHLHEFSKASDAAFNSFSQRAVGNEEAVLKEYYGEAKYNEMLKDAIAEATSGIEIIEGGLDISPISIGGKSFTPPVPSSLTTVSKEVSLDGVSDLGSLESTGVMYLSNYQGKTLGENINTVGRLYIENSGNLQSLGSLKTVEDALIVTSTKLTDLGSLEFVGGSAELTGTSITTTGNLKSADRIGLPATIKDLGVLESVKGELGIHNDSKLTDLGPNIKSVGAIGLKYKEGFKKAEMLESLGGLEVVSDGLNLSIKPGTKLKDLGKLKSIGNLEVEGGSPSLKSLGENIESAGSITLKDNTALDFGNLNSVSLDVTIENSTVDFGNLNDIAIGSLYLTGAKIKDFGKIQSVGGDLAINGLVDSPSAINSIKSVDGNVTILDGPTSLGSIETIGKDLVAPELEDIGSLKSFGQDSHGVQMAITSGYITPEAGGKMLDIIANNERAANDIPSPTTIRRKVGSGIAYENWKASPQSKAQFVGHRFNMNHKGFVPKTTDPAQFKIAVERLHERLSIKAYRDERTGEISGYSMRLDNKFFNPFLKVVQREGDAASLRRKASNYRNQNIHEFINDARGKGYTDRVISAFLKEQGHAAADIKSALEVPVDILGTTLPDGFANAEGGVAIGQQLYNDVIAEVEKYAAAKRLGMPVHSKAQIREKAQELLVNSDVFKAQNPIVQAEMQIGLDKALNIPSASKQLQADFKAVRAMLSNVKKGAAEVSKAKNAMRMFIRKNLPQTVYEKSDVNKLMKAITDATPDSLPAVMQRVSALVNGFHVRDLNASIDKLLKTPTTKTVSGRKVGRMSVSTQNILGMLNDKANPMLADEGMSPENAQKLMEDQAKDFNKLQTKTHLTEEDSDKLTALSIAMMYNEATQMGEDNPYRVEALAAVRDNLKSLISTGRSQMRGLVDAQRAYYNNLISEAYMGVTGEALDLSEDGAEANAEAVRSLKNNQKRKSAYKGGLISFGESLIDATDKWFFARQSDLALLIQRMSSGLSEAAGGNNLMNIFDDRLYNSRVEFTVGKKKAMDSIKAKAQEIWGKDYLVQMERNAISRASSDLINDKNIIWENKAKAESLRKEYNSANNKRKKEIIKKLEGLEVVLSQNEKYYLYNQYKDPANTASFKEKYGEEYARVMKEIEKSLDPKVKEWADWQVNEFYPSLYDRYNQVYKAIYRTNMPWNQFYAGRIYRESEEGDTKFDLLDKGSQYQTSVGGQSTKMRTKNARPIKNMDGNNVLNTYVKDMEYFHAYAESLRDLDKVIQNENVKAAMIEAGGNNSYKALKNMIGKISKQGISGKENEAMNALMNAFVKSKLGLNPTIFLKQLTSGIAFADNIGYRNWAEYTALAMPQARTLWKEWYDNSPLLQERYEDSDIAKVLETYNYQTASNKYPFILDKSIGGKQVTISKRKTAEALNAMMYLVKQGDKGGIMGGLANYLYYKQEFLKKNPGDTEGAIAYASKKTTKEALRTQQDSGITNKDYYQTAGPALRFLTLFTSSPRALLRREMSAFLSLYRKTNGLPTQDSYQDIARRLVTYHVLAPMLFQWVALGLPGLLSDWDEEDKGAMGRAAILGNFNAIFLVGDIVTTAKDLYEGKPWAGEFKTIPLFDQLSIIAKDFQSWQRTKDEDKKNEKFDKLVDHVLELSGIPATSMHRWYNNMEKLLSEDMDKGEALLRLFNYSEYVIGEGNKKKETPKSSSKSSSKSKKSSQPKRKSTGKSDKETSREKGTEALKRASKK